MIETARRICEANLRAAQTATPAELSEPGVTSNTSACQASAYGHPMKAALAGLAMVMLLTAACQGGEAVEQTGVRPASGETVEAVLPSMPSVDGVRACDPASVVTVPAQANIFGSGISDLPSPAGGGGGVAPACLILPLEASAFSIVRANGSATFTPLGAPPVRPHKCSSGLEVTLVSGPDGSPGGCPGESPGGEIAAAGVVSTIASADRVGYLVGVFLPERPPGSPPHGLDFRGHYDFSRLAPALGQLFFIGDGRNADGILQRFVVPRGATHLYLGLADAFGFEGDPGYYGDNAGSFEVRIVFR
jgi:hypothetical protein